MEITVKNTSGRDVGIMLSTEKRVIDDGKSTTFTEEDVTVVLT